MRKEVILTQAEVATLSNLVSWYGEKKEGADLTKTKELLSLKKKGMAFTTFRGWFPSTKGIEAINMLSFRVSHG